jgi:AcrR family transcriptional regulator
MPTRLEAELRAIAQNLAHELVGLEMRSARATLTGALEPPAGAKPHRRLPRSVAAKGTVAATPKPPPGIAPLASGRPAHALPAATHRHRRDGDVAPAAGAGRSRRARWDWSKPRVVAILEGAARVIATVGVDANINDLGAAAGVPKGLIYYYFDDKRRLVLEVLRYSYTKHLEDLRRATDAMVHRDSAAALGVLRGMWSRSGTQALAFDVGVWGHLLESSEVGEHAAALRRQHHQMLADGILPALDGVVGDPARTRPLSTLIIAVMTGLSLGAFLDNDAVLAGEAHELFLELLALGVAKARPSVASPEGARDDIAPGR